MDPFDVLGVEVADEDGLGIVGSVGLTDYNFSDVGTSDGDHDRSCSDAAASAPSAAFGEAIENGDDVDGNPSSVAFFTSGLQQHTGGFEMIDGVEGGLLRNVEPFLDDVPVDRWYSRKPSTLQSVIATAAPNQPRPRKRSGGSATAADTGGLPIASTLSDTTLLQ